MSYAVWWCASLVLSCPTRRSSDLEGLRAGGLDVGVSLAVADPLLGALPGRQRTFALGWVECGEFLRGRFGGRMCAWQQVEVHTDDLLRLGTAQFAGDRRAPVAALRAVARVAQTLHQFGERGGDPAVLPTGLVCRPGRAEPRDVRQH